jgi:hypothetical protein
LNLNSAAVVAVMHFMIGLSSNAIE